MSFGTGSRERHIPIAPGMSARNLSNPRVSRSSTWSPDLISTKTGALPGRSTIRSTSAPSFVRYEQITCPYSASVTTCEEVPNLRYFIFCSAGSNITQQRCSPLSGERSPGFDTILKVMGALELELHAEAAHA